MYVCVWVCACKCRYLQRSEKVLDSPEIELNKVVIHLIWVLRIKRRSSERAANGFSGLAISPALKMISFFQRLVVICEKSKGKNV